MIYAVLILIGLCLLAAALFYFLRSRELVAQLRQAEELWAEKEESYVSELAKLEQLRHIPDVVERAKKAKAEGEARLADAQSLSHKGNIRASSGV